MNTGSHRLLISVLLLLAGGSARADAMDINVNGFIAQGAALSSHYDAIGHSTSGSADLHDAGFTFSYTPYAKLLIAAQTLTRRFGDVDRGDLRLDFLSVDYQLVSTLEHRLGGRIGRLKKPMGFYNESRDVIFTRPGILMPNSVYLEGQGLRDILFAADGAQLYGSHHIGAARLDWKLSAGLDSGADDLVDQFAGDNRSLELTDYLAQQLILEWSSLGIRAGITHFTLGLDGLFTLDDQLLRSDSDIDYWVASLQWNGRDYSLTAEYGLRNDRFHLGTPDGMPVIVTDNYADGFYLQVDRRLKLPITLFARFDWNVADRGDRDGSDYAATSPETRHKHSRYARDHVVGMRWTPNAHWGVFAEYHYYDGTLALGVDSEREHRFWDLALVSIAYKF